MTSRSPRMSSTARDRRLAQALGLTLAAGTLLAVAPSAQAADGAASEPTRLSATAISGGSVRLAWAAPTSVGSSPVSRYDVREADSGTTARTTPDVTTYTWAALKATSVTFKVRAVSKSGAGAWAQVTTSATGSTSPDPSPTPAPSPSPSPAPAPSPSPSPAPAPSPDPAPAPGPADPSSTPIPAQATYVSPSGSDSAAGTAKAPYKTLSYAFKTLRAGDTLIVRGGTYTETVSAALSAGTASSRITVRAYPGERPVVSGLMRLTNASYWTLDGINVTWNTANGSKDHMLKMTGGTGWRITNAEIWGAHSYAGILIAGTPKDFRLDHLYVHNTYRSNDNNQDHLVYINAGNGGGVVENSVFAHSENGRGIKIGPPSPDKVAPIGNVTIRYNTFFDNRGPSNIQLSYSATGNKIYRNIFVQSGSGQPSITAYNLHGSGNQAWDNVGWLSSRVVDVSPNLKDMGGNQMMDPKLDASFKPHVPAMLGFGAFAS